MPRDFTFHVFTQMLSALQEQRYTFQTFAEFLKAPAERVVILRHDVDARKLNSLHAAELEAEMGIRGTFNFRIVLQSFDENVIRKISELGHEIGYHYEDLALAHGDKEKAIILFEKHLAKLRNIVSVETICMHGSPLSKHDNRDIWKTYDYRKYGIIGEPYLDLDFNNMLYLTDTGRMWDGDKVSVRDKVARPVKMNINDGMKNVPLWRACPDLSGGLGEDDKISKKQPFHSTFDIIHGLNKGELPDKIMINVHPQRWEDRAIPWAKELIIQNLKNKIKQFLT